MYKQIAAYLTTRGHISTGDMELSAKLVAGMYKKILRKEEREGAVGVSIGNIRAARS